jgi:uncharacterized protein
VKKRNPQFLKAERFILSMLEKELSPSLSYHNLGHTLDVLHAAMVISDTEGLPPAERKLLRIAVLFHDAGFIYLYKDHEEKACEMVREYLPGFNFTPEQVFSVCEMIMATRIPQDPKNRPGRIIADADLDYLGREDVNLIAQNLFEELRSYQLMPGPQEWIPFQIDFLQQHRYFTDYSRKHREPNKGRYLASLIERLPA